MCTFSLLICQYKIISLLILPTPIVLALTFFIHFYLHPHRALKVCPLTTIYPSIRFTLGCLRYGRIASTHVFQSKHMYMKLLITKTHQHIRAKTNFSGCHTTRAKTFHNNREVCILYPSDFNSFRAKQRSNHTNFCRQAAPRVLSPLTKIHLKPNTV
jgi:hypothetical protein